MTEAEAVRALRHFFAGLFPKVCPKCNRRFATLREYILSTEQTGPAVCYDAELGNWDTRQPIGSMVLSNCPCGSTLALSTEGMALAQRLALLKWLKAEAQGRRVPVSQVLERLRETVRQQVLDGAAPVPQEVRAEPEAARECPKPSPAG